MMDVTHCSVAELAAKLQNKEISAVEVAQQYLDRIEAHKDLNAFLDVRPEETLRQAEAADARIAKGEAGPLTGVPIAHKDIFVTQEWNSTAASRMLEGYRSPFDATVVSKLKSEGMVCLGKLNCDEFATGFGERELRLRQVLQPLGSSGGAGRLVRRLRERCGGPSRPDRDGYRYRRLNP